ncbi:MAG: hypothetical protein J6A58_03300 [Oscillospiraceae bacterium]|nr:hypothetical protein [Oscillospiraceae bacterium]
MKGYLRVRVYTSRKMFPIKNARVEISRYDGKSQSVLVNVLTDENGNTGDIELPVEDEKIPVMYSVRTQADNFIEDVSDGISVYNGIVSIKSVELVLDGIVEG